MQSLRTFVIKHEKHNREYLTRYEGRSPDTPRTRIVIADPTTDEDAIVCIDCYESNFVAVAVKVLHSYGWNVLGYNVAARTIVVGQDYSVRLSRSPFAKPDQWRQLQAIPQTEQPNNRTTLD